MNQITQLIYYHLMKSSPELIALRMIFKSNPTGIVRSFIRDVDPGVKYIVKFRGGIKWYMMESKISYQVSVLK